MKAQRLIATLAAMILSTAVIADDNYNNQDDSGIAPQALDTALEEFAERSGLQVIYLADVAKGKRSPGAEPDLSDQATLDQLLASTDLEYEFLNDNTVTLQATDERGASDSKNLSAGPMLMAQSQTNQAQAISSRSDAGGNSIVTGKVTDARTGANLKGARITIEETGQWTSTNDLGEFRIVNVPTGSATLTVSYLGYAGQSVVVGVRGDGTSHDFVLRGGSTVEEIVVFGQRSARALALNQERTAENFTTVLSADVLGNFPGTTISEALRRAPGVAFSQDPVTGDGTNIVVRGLAPDFNQVKLNGVRLPEGSGLGRSADLSNILTESISKITISKTLLPSDDSVGSGGLVEIETKGPLDRPSRFASIAVESGERSNNFREDLQASGTISGRFGEDENFGISASVQYVDQEIRRTSYSLSPASRTPGQYLPLDANGEPILVQNSIDPRRQFPFEPGVNEVYPTSTTNSFNGANTENFSLTLSGQWDIGGHTSLRLDFTDAEEKRDSFARSFVISNFATGRELFPIDELGGEPRYHLVSEGLFADFGVPGIVLLASQDYSIEKDRSDSTRTYSLQGTSMFKQWELDYTVGIAKGEVEVPYSAKLNVGRPFGIDFAGIDGSLLLPEARNNTIGGRIVSPYLPIVAGSNRYQLPALNQQGLDFYNDPSNYLLSGAEIDTGTAGENSRESIDFGVKRNLKNEYLRYVQAGVFAESSKFVNRPVLSDNRLRVSSSAESIADVGLSFTGQSLSEIGLNGMLNVIDQRDVEEFLAGIQGIANANPDVTISPLSPRDPRLQQTFTEEENFAAYLQGRVDVGRLEIVAGARFDRVKIRARNVLFPTFIDIDGAFDDELVERFNVVVDQEATLTDVLPRMIAAYRHTDNLVLRFGYFRSVARPQIRDLSAEKTTDLDLSTASDALGLPTLRVGQGNPDLEPSKTDSFDLSFEYYDDAIGVIKASVFYKSIDNLLELTATEGFDSLQAANVELPDDFRFQDVIDNPENYFIVLTTPTNSDFSSRIWGMEAAFEKQLTFLPSWWGGLGIYANYTYTDSSKKIKSEFFNTELGDAETVTISGVPFTGDPKHSGTAALTYSMNNIDASLAYSMQDRRLNSFGRFNLSAYDESDESLDLRAEYRIERLGGTWRVWFEGTDLLKGTTDPDVESSIGGTRGTPKYFTGGNYFGGREFRLGVAASFD